MKITPDHLARGAFIYIRQSTVDQLANNHESRLRQYGLADRARALGWTDVTVIDDGLGHSGSGVSRPGLGRTRQSWPKYARWCCRQSSAMGRSRHGSSTIRVSPSRGGTRSGWHDNTAANSASRTIVRSQCRCRSPIIMRACRWPISYICRKTGQRTAPADARQVFPSRSVSKPSHELRLSSCVGHVRLACRAAWC